MIRFYHSTSLITLGIWAFINVQISDQMTTSQEILSSELITFNFTQSQRTRSDVVKEDIVNEENDAISACEVTQSPAISMYRNGQTNPDKLWKHLRYYLDGELTQDQRHRIHIAVGILGNILPCVTFEEISDPISYHESYVVVERGGGCYSYIGRTGHKQEIVLDDRCLGDLKVILHEFFHALGLAHEQNRPDRDDYVVIQWENIKPGKKHNFEKVDDPPFSTFGVAYNPRSIMHYGLHAWSVSARSTINFRIGAKLAPDEPISFGKIEFTGLQRTDIDKIRKMYDCGYF